MSSREIAELTGKEHFNVCRDIRKMLADLGLDALSFEGMSSDAYGRPLKVFNLPKDLTLTLVSGYSVPVRHRIVTRLQELESTKPPAIRTDDAGRFCLNDLHRAAGGKSGDQPAFFMRRVETARLIEALRDAGGVCESAEAPVQVVNDGRNNGTWVVKELVYAYAMWVSPKFHIQVIRA